MRIRRRPAARVLLVDVAAAPAPDPTELLFALVAEAVVLQDLAEAVLTSVGRGEHLGLVAPRGGPLVWRFFALRDRLPALDGDARLRRTVAELDTILLHHALQVATSLEFLAAADRSARSTQLASSFAGLGRPAALLDEIYAELRTRRLASTSVRPVVGRAPEEYL